MAAEPDAAGNAPRILRQSRAAFPFPHFCGRNCGRNFGTTAVRAAASAESVAAVEPDAASNVPESHSVNPARRFPYRTFAAVAAAEHATAEPDVAGNAPESSVNPAPGFPLPHFCGGNRGGSFDGDGRSCGFGGVRDGGAGRGR